jgi:hypothetical protein
LLLCPFEEFIALCNIYCIVHLTFWKNNELRNALTKWQKDIMSRNLLMWNISVMETYISSLAHFKINMDYALYLIYGIYWYLLITASNTTGTKFGTGRVPLPGAARRSVLFIFSFQYLFKSIIARLCIFF